MKAGGLAESWGQTVLFREWQAFGQPTWAKNETLSKKTKQTTTTKSSQNKGI